MSADVATTLELDRLSEHDLADMLSFFERNGSGPEQQNVEPPDDLFAMSSSSVDGSSDAAAVPTKDQGQSRTSSPAIQSATTAAQAYCGFIPAPQLQRTLRGHSLLVAHNGAVLGVVPHTVHATDYFQQQATSLHGNRDLKLGVSHSNIEKQRRDRINSLIDELRELVPSAGAIKGPDGAVMRRPKHAVLSDTISLVKHLKQKTEHDQGQLQQLKKTLTRNANIKTAAAGKYAAADAASDTSAQSLLQHSLSCAAPAAVVFSAPATGAVTSSVCPELPQAPLNLPCAVGVLVEEGDGCFIVKVNCKDRHGLLSDITNAIKGLPLQITRAAITTSESGAVYDVFEMLAEPNSDLEGLTALDVQFQVHQALHKTGRTALKAHSPWHYAMDDLLVGDCIESKNAKRRRSD